MLTESQQVVNFEEVAGFSARGEEMQAAKYSLNLVDLPFNLPHLLMAFASHPYENAQSGQLELCLLFLKTIKPFFCHRF